MRQNWSFRQTCCINNSHWQSSGIIIFLCKYYVIIPDKLLDSSLDVLFLLLAVILSGLHEKSRRNKDWVTEKNTLSIKELSEEHDFFDCMPFFLCHFLLLSSSFLFVVFVLFFKKGTCWVAPIKMHNIAIGGNICDDSMSERLKIWKSFLI